MAFIPKQFNEVLNFTRGTGATRLNAAGLIVGVDFSSTSNTITTGSKTFTLTADANVNRDWPVGSSVIAVSQAGATGTMTGVVTSYTPSTQALVIEVASITGSGTSTNWRIGSLEVRRDSNGVLVEGQASNISNSNNFSSFTAVTLTRTANTVLTPSGSIDASTLTENAGAGEKYITRALGTQTGIFTYSVFAKANGRRYIYIREDGSTGFRASFDLELGLVSQNVNAIEPTITSFGNGWYRCSISVFHNNQAASFRIGLSNDGNTVANYTGDGVSGVHVYHAQFESGSITSVIPTTTVAVTRAADSLTATATTLAALRQGEGTLVVTAVNPDNSIAQKRALRLTGANGEIRIAKQGTGTTANFTKMAEGAGLRLMPTNNMPNGFIANNGLETFGLTPLYDINGIANSNFAAVNAVAYDGVSNFGFVGGATSQIEFLLRNNQQNMRLLGLGGTQINGAHYNGSRFIISTSVAGVVGISTDGISYRTINTPVITQPTNEVTSGLVGAINRVVIVGNTGFIATSDDDGETWTSRTSGAGGNLLGVTFNGTNQFLTVSSNASTRISSDGINWTVGGTVPFTPIDVHFANGVYVVVGGQGGAQRIATSADNGASWTLRFSGAAGDLLGVTYSPNLNLWVAVGGNGGIVTATDPTGTWTAQISGTALTLNEVGIFNNAIFVVGSGSTLLTSTNGTTYTSLTANVNSTLIGIAASPTTLLITGSAGAMASSTDGTTFTSRTNNGATLNGIAFGANRFVSVGNAANGSGYIATIDADGTVTRRVSGVTAGIAGIDNLNGEFFAFLSGNNTTALKSSDGLTYTSITLGSNASYTSGAFGSGKYLIVANQSVVAFSSNGTTFSSVNISGVGTSNIPASSTFNSCAFANGVFVAVGNSGRMFTCTDPTNTATYLARTSGTTQNLTSVMYSTRDSRWYAAGNAGTLLFSEDNGVTWQSVQNAGLGAINAAGTSQVNALLPAFRAGSNKIAISFKQNQVSTSLNGVSVTDSSATIPPFNAISFGDSFNGYITSVNALNNALTAAELNQVTGA